jgi:hypothetical protein
MRRIFVPTRGPEDWQRLLAKPELHWRSDRSAALLAEAWETAQDLPQPVRGVLEQAGDPACHRHQAAPTALAAPARLWLGWVHMPSR